MRGRRRGPPSYQLSVVGYRVCRPRKRLCLTRRSIGDWESSIQAIHQPSTIRQGQAAARGRAGVELMRRSRLDRSGTARRSSIVIGYRLSVIGSAESSIQNPESRIRPLKHRTSNAQRRISDQRSITQRRLAQAPLQRSAIGHQRNRIRIMNRVKGFASRGRASMLDAPCSLLHAPCSMLPALCSLLFALCSA